MYFIRICVSRYSKKLLAIQNFLCNSKFEKKVWPECRSLKPSDDRALHYVKLFVCTCSTTKCYTIIMFLEFYSNFDAM